MFDISSLQYNSAHPGFTSILITVMSSMILGVLLAYTYDKTSRDVNRPNHFLQAMVLVTIVAATVIQAIGDSVARGLGMIGALSIIRFRTTVRDPRNLVFMFGAIAVGISTGVFGFVIAVVGTLGFCITAFLLYYSSFSPKDSFIGKLKIEINSGIVSIMEVNKIISMHCNKYQLKKQHFDISKVSIASVSDKEPIESTVHNSLQAITATVYNTIHLNYDIKLKSKKTVQMLIDALIEKEGVTLLKYGMDRNTSIDI